MYIHDIAVGGAPETHNAFLEALSRTLPGNPSNFGELKRYSACACESDYELETLRVSQTAFVEDMLRPSNAIRQQTFPSFWR